MQKYGVNGILRLVLEKPRECEFRHCLAYFDGKITQPKLFEFNAEGTLSTQPRGKMQDYHWLELVRIFIPTGKIKTLAEMSKKEYEEWSTGRYENHFAEFAKWLSKMK